LQGGLASPIPRSFEVALWIDFACINQDGAPAQELEERMAAIIGVCDLLLTPIVDKKESSWKLPMTFDNPIEDYKAAAWKEYWQRAWCRVEAYLAANLPLTEGEERANLFRGGLRSAQLAGRRPHVIFGTKEYRAQRPPMFLPGMVDATFRRYPPAGGELTSEADRPVIRALTEEARRHSPDGAPGYRGDLCPKGKANGYGRQTYEDGGVYDGEWAQGVPHGEGTYLWTWGDRFTGEWVHGKKHGHGMHTYADGGRFIGIMKNDVRQGHGEFFYHFGDHYRGFYENDLKAVGSWHFNNGDCRVCRWELHEDGDRSVVRGEGAYWAADRLTAWRLEDGVKTSQCTLDAAAAIRGRLGLGRATPAAYTPSHSQAACNWARFRVAHTLVTPTPTPAPPPPASHGVKISQSHEAASDWAHGVKTSQGHVGQLRQTALLASTARAFVSAGRDWQKQQASMFLRAWFV